MKETGQILQKKRLEKNISIETVHQLTRIPKRYIEAIENGDIKAFSAEVYYIGSLKKYSLYLGINPEEFVEKFHNSKNVDIKNTIPQKHIEINIMNIIYPVLAALIIGILYAVFANYSIKHSITHAKAAKEPKTVEIQQHPPAAEKSKLELEIKSLSSSWVKIIADDKIVYEGVLQQSQQKTFGANDKFILKIGYTPGIRVKLNDVDIDINHGSKQDVNDIVLNIDSLKQQKKSDSLKKAQKKKTGNYSNQLSTSTKIEHKVIVSSEAVKDNSVIEQKKDNPVIEQKNNAQQ
jgi:hypothetical protein